VRSGAWRGERPLAEQTHIALGRDRTRCHRAHRSAIRDRIFGRHATAAGYSAPGPMDRLRGKLPAFDLPSSDQIPGRVLIAHAHGDTTVASVKIKPAEVACE